MKKVYPTMREALFGALSYLHRLSESSRQLSGRTYQEGFEEGWHFATNALTATIGQGVTNPAVEQLLIFFPSLDINSIDETGTWNDGFKQAIMSVVVGSVSILASAPAEPRDAYIQWEHILTPPEGRTLN
jgi:hypothetical protein